MNRSEASRDEMAEAIEDAYQRGRDDALEELTNVEALDILVEDGVPNGAMAFIDVDRTISGLLTNKPIAADMVLRALLQAAEAADKERAALSASK